MLCKAPDEAKAQDLAANVLAEKLAVGETSSTEPTPLTYWEGMLMNYYEWQMRLYITVSPQQSL